MAAKKKKNLVIVESPAKAKTINKYLGDDFEVVASKGHVRDLPKSRFGIDIEKGWIPTYRPLKDRKEVLQSLKKQAAKAGIVYLAPDPDREGEAIAWHLKEALGLSDERTRRVTFNEITKTAVQKAFKDAGQINMDRVQAQEARRFLDRVVGYKLSPLLSRRLTETLSAGRVQSVAVRMIVEREREIQAFKPEEFWKIAAVLRPTGTGGPKVAIAKVGTLRLAKAKGKGEGEEQDEGEGENKRAAEEPLPEGAFVAELAEWAGEKFKAASAEQSGAIVKALEGAGYVVSKIEQKDRQEKPPAPFTTSTLQQQASLRLRFSAKRTMMIAQRLYEGVEVSGEGSVALITYMRTDSTRISPDALTACRGHIKTTFGDRYLPDKPNVYASGKGAQDAHEAIRPTDVAYTPERLAKFAAPGAVAALYADLQPLRRQPDEPGHFRHHQRGGRRRPGNFQGPGQNPEVRRFPQGPCPREQAGRRPAAAVDRTASPGSAQAQRQSALHRAAAALQRGLAGQDAGKGRHRPAQHVRQHHQQDRRSQICRAEGTPFLCHASSA